MAIQDKNEKNANYCVIGGQYSWYDYGFAPTLLGAKRLAAKHDEYWDNWQGWHRPAVYAAADVELVTSQFYGNVYAPRPNARPVALYDNRQGRWMTSEKLDELYSC